MQLLNYYYYKSAFYSLRMRTNICSSSIVKIFYCWLFNKTEFFLHIQENIYNQTRNEPLNVFSKSCQKFQI